MIRDPDEKQGFGIWDRFWLSYLSLFACFHYTRTRINGNQRSPISRSPVFLRIDQPNVLFCE